MSSESTFTDKDAAWLQAHQHRKVLDARVRIIGVAARDPSDDHPLVLMCYPLRTTGPASSDQALHGNRRDLRGGSKRKWMADQPVPWPNFYWLVCPVLAHRVGRLEHLGYVQRWQQEVKTDQDLAASLAAAHREYGATRWAALSDEDRTYCLAHEAYTAALRDTGVGGLRFESQIKCLHAHLSHALAGGNNPVGRRVVNALERAEDNAVLSSSAPTPPSVDSC